MYIQGTKSKKLISYIENVADHLGLFDLPPVIEIDIKKECAAGAGGYCHGDEDSIYIEVARYDNEGKIPQSQLMTNIAHELVHAQQIAQGRLVNVGFIFSRLSNGDRGLSLAWDWEGKRYINTAYDDHPWEHEAYSAEEELYNLFK
jgi:hypothetical protein